ncbi:flagellar basal body P-ring formation chaperone FlgA [Pararhizobium mangrovi]|uniref:Flagella basal body P-ring formation protein FlgA n=1 Tax=Pararhizobium mangrovi TaxID=2590452 RepID=A0A506TZG3_9HYPH|nr:flagellar basal body P-ring formation chaperone FlgA [Pararhizobium mangrovi]TPW26890.1 flagellar basal body P-ring formation protein FlgA [Pararhizobium mangrovi]
MGASTTTVADIKRFSLRVSVELALAAGLTFVPASAFAGAPTAVVPQSVIYPGQEIATHALKEVTVTNPNIRDDYVHTAAELQGKVATRTLLPGRVIPAASVREPYAVKRGSKVRIVFATDGLTISAPGMPLANATVGDFIRVRNVDTGVTVSGTVTADDTVEVAAR